MIASDSKPETRVKDAQYYMDPADELQKMVQGANEDLQSPPPSQSAMVSLYPIPISESATGPAGAGLISFGTIVEPAYCTNGIIMHDASSQ